MIKIIERLRQFRLEERQEQFPYGWYCYFTTAFRTPIKILGNTFLSVMVSLFIIYFMHGCISRSGLFLSCVGLCLIGYPKDRVWSDQNDNPEAKDFCSFIGFVCLLIGALLWGLGV